MCEWFIFFHFNIVLSGILIELCQSQQLPSLLYHLSLIWVVNFFDWIMKTDFVEIIVALSYEQKCSLNQLTIVFQNYHFRANYYPFAFLLVLEWCPYEPALVKGKRFCSSTRFPIDCV